MPIYEYACSACGRQEERLESLAAPSVQDCPACGASQGLTRQFSVAAVAMADGGATSNASPACATGACPFAS